MDVEHRKLEESHSKAGLRQIQGHLVKKVQKDRVSLGAQTSSRVRINIETPQIIWRKQMIE